MISQDIKGKKSSFSLLSLGTSKQDKSSSFSQLLQTLSQNNDSKSTKIDNLILALNPNEKDVKTQKNSLKTEKISTESKLQKISTKSDSLQDMDIDELKEFNPNISTKDLKELLYDAKNFLKDKIQQSDGYKQAEIKELPNTVDGLLKAAQKLQIDVSKISVEEVKEYAKNRKEVGVQGSLQTIESGFGSDKNDNEIKPQVANQVVQNLEVAKKESYMQTVLSAKDNFEEIKPQVVSQVVQNSVSQTPLFKAQSETATTEQLVQAKINNSIKSEQETSKESGSEALKLLLHGEKNNKDSSSSAEIPSIAVKATMPILATESIGTQETNSLEKLLKNDILTNGQNAQPVEAKSDLAQTSKIDSLDVKINEAKQMIRYLSDDIKNAIDDYKSPFTRVKVQLNPGHLGEIDLTVIQRGKDLHVNISSNNNAINLLSMNANELKTQLQNSGINSATLNFSSSQNGNSSAGEQQQRENQKRATQEYGYFENEEQHEETLNSLEIIVPRYG